MKMNWGTGLAIVLGLFIIGMGFVTYNAMNQRHDLVTTDYYQKELAYQGTIDATKNAEALGEECSFVINDAKVSLAFPSALENQKGELNLELYYPTMAERDFNLSKSDWNITTLDLPSEKLASGKWIAKIHLQLGDKAYYFETETTLR